MLELRQRTEKPITERSYLLSLNCVHNAGTNHVNGKLCEDCGRFIEKGTLEYFMTDGIFEIWMALHNRGAKYRRGETDKDLDIELKILIEKLEDRDGILKMTEVDAKSFMDDTYKTLSKHKVLDTEALIHK